MYETKLLSHDLHQVIIIYILPSILVLPRPGFIFKRTIVRFKKPYHLLKTESIYIK